MMVMRLLVFARGWVAVDAHVGPSAKIGSCAAEHVMFVAKRQPLRRVIVVLEI